jgi:hypothetical protein
VVAACQDAGLFVRRKLTDPRSVLVVASISPIGKKFWITGPWINVTATVGADGRWDERVEIRAVTYKVHPDIAALSSDPFFKHNATMIARVVALADLTSELMDVARQLRLAQDALGRGEQGPWHFAEATWVRNPIV